MTSSNQPYVARWGIMACGGIAGTFTRDLLLNPSESRNVNDVQHQVVAVASSSSVDKAKTFVSENKCPSSTKTYGSYEDLVRDDDVQIIYIASPHAQHYENTLLALRNGKNVCCEKPFTINAKQTKHLIEVAREKNLFLMEAMWTRFFPVVLELQRLIHQERILGPIVRVQADFGMPFKFDPKHRLFNPDLGGGALLDLGIYPLTWLMMTVYDDPANKKQMPSLIRSAVLKVRETGVDAHTSATLIFDAIHASATMTTNLEVASHWAAHHTLIQGEKGTITVHGRPYRPESFKVFLKDQDGELGEPQEHNFPINGQGMHWEADACARCLRDGKTEEQLCSWNDSIATMTILDTIRQQNDFTYPSSIEAVQKQ